MRAEELRITTTSSTHSVGRMAPMVMHSTKHKLLVGLVAGAILLSGCGASGDATCRQYLKMSERDQNKIVKALVKNRGESSKDAEAAMRVQISAFCTVAKPDAKIIETLGK